MRAIDARRLRVVALRSLLAVALVLVQLGALTHLVGHAGAAATPLPVDASDDDRDTERLPALCLDCAALAGLDLPLGDSGAPHFGDAASSITPIFTPARRTSTDAPAPRCRAPPRAGA